MVICSDSAAVLSSVKTGRSDRGDLCMEMMELLMGLERMGVVVKLLLGSSPSGCGG